MLWAGPGPAGPACLALQGEEGGACGDTHGALRGCVGCLEVC